MILIMSFMISKMNNDKSISIPLYFEFHIFLIIAKGLVISYNDTMWGLGYNNAGVWFRLPLMYMYSVCLNIGEFHAQGNNV
jgi:hypothetical protein